MNTFSIFEEKERERFRTFYQEKCERVTSTKIYLKDAFFPTHFNVNFNI